MSDFKVELYAVSVKSLNIRAETAQEATEKALSICFDSDLMSFTDDDVSMIEFSAEEINHKEYDVCYAVRADGEFTIFRDSLEAEQNEY